MKKQLLSLFAVSLTLCAAAQVNSEIEYKWGKLIDGETTAGDQSTDVALDADGNVFWFGTYGTKTDLPTVNFGGEFLFTGAEYEGTSQNNNYTLIKTDADGNKLWVVYSNSGDFANNAGGCATTSDGGIITACYVRHTDGFQDKDINIVDANGTETKLSWEDPAVGKCAYKILVCKITSEGAVSWTRIIEVSTEAGPSASGSYADYWVNCVNVGSCAVDDNDNIYIALNYRNELSIEKADGTQQTFKATNISTWNGDPQTAVGDFMVLGLDNNGYYRNAITFEGTASVAYCQKVTYDNGNIYAQGYITGNGSDLKAGEFTLSPNTTMSPVLLCADTDFNLKWAKCYKGEPVQTKTGFQNVGITACGNALWMCGQFNLKFTDPDNEENFLTSTQGSIREGFILKLDAETGAWVGARNSREDEWNYPAAAAKTGLTGYLKVLQNAEHPEKIYVFGYVMNATVGAFLREYDAETLVANLENGQNNVVTQGGVPSVQAIAYDGKNCCAYLTTRGNKAFSCLGTNTDAPTSWGILAAKFQLPESMKVTTSISSIVVEDNNNAPVEYFNLQGIRVNNLENGVFIRRQGSKTEKVIIR